MKSKAKLFKSLIISALAVVIAVVITLYSLFIQDTIFKESSKHLSEIYGQTDAFFQGRITSHRNIMKSWEPYIKATANDPDKQAEFEEFIDGQREALNFTRCSFINMDNVSEGEVLAKDRDGRVYTLQLRRNALNAFVRDENDVGVACMRQYHEGTGIQVRDKTGKILAEAGKARRDYDPNDRFIMLSVDFAERDYYIAPGEDPENAFYYTAIAFFFDVEAISYVLSVDAFEGMGSCFLVLPTSVDTDSDGIVLLQSSNDAVFVKKSGQWNFPTFLKEETNMKAEDVDALQQEWAQMNRSSATAEEKAPKTTLFKVKGGQQYYLNYRPVGYSDWVLLGVVPANIVNESMTQLRTVTIIVMAAIFVVLGGGVAWYIIMMGRRKVRDQELALKSREKLFDLLTLNSDDIFALFNSQTGEAEYVSQNVEPVLGLSVESVKNDIFTIMEASPQNVEGFARHENRDYGDGIVVEELPMRNVKNKTEYYFRFVINPTQYRDDSRYVMMLSDRTRERQMRADLEAALNIAKSANEAKSNFLSNMSHDIRTPMNAIIGFTTLLEKDVENPAKAREYIRKISFSSHHLLSLINDILDMSKIESGKSALHIAEFSLPELLEELNSIIITQVTSKQQTFEMRTKGSIPELVYGDRLRLNQVMINLLSNAVKYTPAGGEISLTVEALDESVRNHAHLRFSVKDNGLGMSEDFVKVIFEPFSRETTAYTKEIQGTGLGMAITKQIVDLMGGTITVKSKRGEGSEFIVEIELAKVVHHHGDSTEFWKKHNIGRMLVVDDEEDVCIEVKELMSDTGVEVDYATSGQGALDKITAMKNGETKYDIVLLDWKMPGMDGLEAAKHIREIVSLDLPMMVLTSYNFEEIESEAESAGIHVFLPKPFFVSNFRNAVAKLQEEDEEEEQEQATEAECSLEGLNILAAEDNPINAEILEELLDIEGATCTIAENGQIALETFEKSEPGTYNMIFMDVQMPVMNGHEAAKAIRASAHPEAKTIPIIAMTANAFDDDKKMARDAGMDAHVAKPIDMNVLKKTVAKLRGGRNNE